MPGSKAPSELRAQTHLLAFGGEPTDDGRSIAKIFVTS
jgi:hypothetical protein